MKIDKNLFRTYDIRGTYGENLTEEAVFYIGWAFAKYSNAKTFLVAQDMRTSSRSLKEVLMKGIKYGGVEKIYDAGLVSSPLHYFTNGILGVDASIMLTASHSPPEKNGLKVCLNQARIQGGDALMKLYEMIVALEKEVDFESLEIPKSEKTDKLKEYTNAVTKGFEFNKKFKIVIDSANSMGLVEKKPIEKYPEFEIINMFDKLDGRMPNHEADPMKDKNIEDLQKRVLLEKADLGLSFDGDADRVIFIDEKGQRVQGDVIVGILSILMLESIPGGLVFYDLRTSKLIPEMIEEAGGDSEMTPVGNTTIKRRMRKDRGMLGYELAGHYHFSKLYFSESSALPVLYVLKYLESENITLSEATKRFTKYFKLHEHNFEHPDKDKLLELFKQKYQAGSKLITIDGYLFDYGDWWFNVRKSANDPVVRLVMESKTEALFQEKKKELLKFFKDNGAKPEA